MKILMLSLDKKILDVESLTAGRMILNAGENSLFILIPDEKKRDVILNGRVRALSTGGNKFNQFFKLIFLGQEKIKKYQIEMVTAQDPFFVGLAGWILKILTGIKLEIQLHGDFYSNSYYKKNSWEDKFKFYLSKFIVKRADVIRTVGERVKKSLLKMGLAENKIVVRPVAIDYERIKKQESRSNLRGKYPAYSKIFLFLGRFEPVKNIPWLIKVFQQVVEKRSDYLLLLVGGGRQEEKIKQKIKDLKLEKNIIVEGWTSDPMGYLKTVDCLLLPSLSEGYGLVALEAVAVGCPVIMNDVGVAHYELQPGPVIKIVPVGDKERFVQAILSL